MNTFARVAPTVEVLEARIAPASFHWNVDGNGNWNDESNWVNETIPLAGGFPDGVGDVAKFFNVITANRTITIPAGVTITVGTITFNDDNNYNIVNGSGGGLVLDVTSGSAIINSAGTNGDGAHTISAPITLHDDVDVTVNSSGTLTISGAIGDGGGALGLTKLGTGTLRLGNDRTIGGSNTYTGFTNVNAGTLELAKLSATAIVGGLNIGDDSGSGVDTLRLIASNQIATAFSIHVNSTGMLDLNGQNQTISGLILESGPSSGAQVTTGAGTLTLNGGVFLTALSGGAVGATIAGKLDLGAVTRSFTVDNGTAQADLDISAAISGSTAVGLDLTGVLANPGTLRLSGPAGNTYSGTTTVEGGTLELGKAAIAVPGPLVIGDGSGADTVRLLASDDIADSVVITVKSSGRLDLNGQNETIGTLSLESGTSSGALVTTGLGTLTLGGDVTLAVTGNGATGASIAGSGRIDLGSATHVFTVLHGSGNSTFDLDISTVISGSAGGGLTKTGAGTLEFGALATNGPNTYTGTTTIADGKLLLNQISGGGALAIAGPLIIGDGVGAFESATVRYTSFGDQIADTASVTVKTDGFLDLNGNSDTIGPLTLESGTTSRAEVETGAGTLVLGGDVTINVTGTGAVGAQIAGNLDLGSAPRTFTVAHGGGNGTADLGLFAVISGGAGAGFTKTGAGTLDLNGAADNTYSGTTTVADGTLVLDQQVGGSTFKVAIPGPLVVGDGSGAGASAAVKYFHGDQIADSAPVTVRADGLLNLNNTADNIGALALESGDASGAQVTTGSGTLTLGGDVALNVSGTGAAGASISGKLSLGNATRTFIIADGAALTDLDVSAAMVNGGLIKDGAGRLLFSAAANAYASDTIVEGGALIVNGSLQSAVHLAGGTLGGSGSVPSIIADAQGGSVAPGASTAILTAASATLNAATSFAVEINGTIPGADHDQLHATGGVDLGGAALSLSLGFIPSPGETFTILDKSSAGDIAGHFAGLEADGATVQTPAGNFTINYHGGDGNDVVLTPVFITPAFSAKNHVAKFTDRDGDLVTITTSKGTFAADQFLIFGVGAQGGGQLARLDLSDPADLFAKTTLNIIAAKPRGGTGDGFVDVGAIDATGIDLAKVTIKGDLGQVDAGDAETHLTPALKLLKVHSLGLRGLTTQSSGGSLHSDINGALGRCLVAGDVTGASIIALAGADAKIGSIKIGGSLIGTTDASIETTGSIGPVFIAHDVIGGSGFESGAFVISGTLARVTIGGSLIGGEGTASGSIVAGGAAGPIKTVGDLRGGGGLNSGIIEIGGSLTSATISGSVEGGSGQQSGRLNAGGTSGAVKIGKDLHGGAGDASGSVTVSGRLARLTIAGDVIAGNASAIIRAGADLAALTVKGSIAGTAAFPVVITAEGQAVPGKKSDVAIGRITVLGSVEQARILAGFDITVHAANADASIGAVFVKGDWTASDLIAGAQNLGPTGSVSDDNLNFGDANDALQTVSDDPLLTARIASITIKGGLAGTAAAGDAFGFVAQEIGGFRAHGIVTPLVKGVNDGLIGLLTTSTADLALHEL